MPPRPHGPRGPKRPKRGSVMDGIYTFIYGVHKRRFNKPFPRGKYEGYSGALAEIGTQPLVFPLNQSFKTIDDAINNSVATKIPYSKGKSQKIGIATPRNFFMLNRLMMPRPVDSWMRIGGNLHYDSDGALVGLYARREGADGDDANELGHLYRDIYRYDVRMAYRMLRFNYSVKKADDVFNASEDADEMEYYERGNQFRSRATTVFARTLVRNIPSISGRATEEGIKDFLDSMQTVENKHERITRTYRYFCDTCGFTEETSHALAQNLWGYQGRGSTLDSNGNYDLGCYRADGEILRQEERRKQHEIDLQKDAVRDAILKQREVDHIKTMIANGDPMAAVFSQSQTYGLRITSDEYEDLKDQANNHELVETINNAVRGNATARSTILSDPNAFAARFVLDAGTRVTGDEIRNLINTTGVTTADVNTFITSKNIRHATADDTLEDLLNRHNIFHIEANQGNSIIANLDSEANSDIVGRCDRDIALNLINMSIAIQQMSHAGSRMNADSLNTSINCVNSYITNNTSRGMGYRRERALLTFRYLTTAGFFSTPDFLWGKWENFGKLDGSLVESLDFCQIVQDATVEGDKTAKYVKPANSIIGHLIGGMYYYHPVNLIKGLFDGSVFYSLSHGQRNAFYVLGKANIQSAFSGYSKIREKIISGITSTIAPPLRLISKGFRSFVGKLIGTVGFAGVIASFVIDRFQDKIDTLIGKIVGAIFYGILCILALFLCVGGGSSFKQVTMLLEKDNDKNVVVEEDNNTFDEADLGIDLIN